MPQYSYNNIIIIATNIINVVILKFLLAYLAVYLTITKALA